MTMNSKKLTDEYLSFTEDEFKAGNMAKDIYSKVMVQIAAEYLSEHHDEETCMKVLCKIEPTYFKEALLTQMKDDSFLSALMLEFAYHLERQGITWEGSVRPTQNEAKA